MNIKIKTQQQCLLRLNIIFFFFLNCNKIWQNIETLMDIDFNTKPTYSDDDKYIKTKIKTDEDNITTNFYDQKGSKKVPEEKIPHKL